ncbi:NTPase [Saccharopolyspora sp. NFXS83]|uniref:NACHT domain-containing protein n=1 Tax=Saccharopolyspora sp. NFXS83 TaxID=2993560 RepID=UPI00224AC8A5|nr:NTPase [Saccharopolyspora sp. NFXS83]MCX2729802.1 NTPase [Saccharopolyspora sp. NFXS83]
MPDPAPRHEPGARVSPRRPEVTVTNSADTAGDVVQIGLARDVTIIHEHIRPAQGPHAEPLRALTAAVRDRWESERPTRIPIQVRWREAPEALTDHHANMLDHAGGEPPDPAGELSRITEVFRGTPDGRLVVLGEVGSGKTFLAARFVLNVLDVLKGRHDDQAVPIIFNLGSWDPTGLSLTTWMLERLALDFPQSDTAALFRDGHVLPVLDGFDEIAEGLRGVALEVINEYPRPLFLTSRPAEYAAAVSATKALERTTVVQLCELTPDEATEHLWRTAKKEMNHDGSTWTKWGPVLERLREHPDAPGCRELGAALSSPLMVWLARTIYQYGNDPQELLDTTRFGTREAVEDHLLSSLVPTVFDPRPGGHSEAASREWNPENVEHWLGRLARHLQRLGDTQDLAWWEISGTMHRRSRALVIALVTGLIIFLAMSLMNGTIFLWAGADIGDALRTSMTSGLISGVVAGTAFGIAYGTALVINRARTEPSRMRLPLRGRRGAQPRSGRRIATRTAVASLLGLGFGFMSGSGTRLLLAWLENPLHLASLWVDGVLYAIMYGTGAAVVFGTAAVLEAPIKTESTADPISLLRSNRATTLHMLLIFGPAFGAAVGLSGSALVTLFDGNFWGIPLYWDVAATIQYAAVGTVGGGLSAALGFTAWGEWLVFGRLWLPLTGRLPWRTVAFLQDAHELGVLRTHGSVYQFRHGRLRDHLAATEHARRSKENGRRPRAAP